MPVYEFNINIPKWNNGQNLIENRFGNGLILGMNVFGERSWEVQELRWRLGEGIAKKAMQRWWMT